MQLLGNAFPDGFDSYYVEDIVILAYLDQTYPRGVMDNTSRFERDVVGSNPSEDTTPVDVEVLRDLLLLVSYDVPEKVIEGWSLSRRDCVESWAVCFHLRASDNIVTVPERPDCLNGYEDDDQHLDWMNETPP